MTQILKYTLTPTARCTVDMPADAVILDCQEQNDRATIWVAGTLSCPLITREFCQLTTGATIPDDVSKYIGSVQVQDRTILIHVFEVTK